jgi:4-amino-4-deoxy-L-arabinose transferase-like glycosyltransferase
MRSIFFWLIVVVYLGLGAYFAIETPAWQAPDEPAHYNYVAQVAEGEILPVIADGDWNQAYLDELRANRFAAELLDDIDTIRYENHQPPLYYWLASLPYVLTDGDLVAIRLFSVALGLVTVIAAYAIGRELYPSQPAIGLGVMALVAFLPQHLAIIASVNNDALAGAVVALGLLAIISYLKGGQVSAVRLGYIGGIVIISKTTGYFLLGLILLAILLRTLRTRENAFVRLFMAGIPIALFAMFWFGRNILTYGFPDFLGLAAHDRIVVGQLRTAELIDQIGTNDYLLRGAETTFKSYWGQFGWMAVPMPDWVYMAIAGVLVIAGLGWLLRIAVPRASKPYKPLDEPFPEVSYAVFVDDDTRLPYSESVDDTVEGLPAGVRGHIWLILLLALTLAMAQFVYYNTEFVQFQGRYMFGGIISLALLIVVGVDSWRNLILRRAWGLTVLVFLALAVLDYWALTRWIVSNLAV